MRGTGGILTTQPEELSLSQGDAKVDDNGSGWHPGSLTYSSSLAGAVQTATIHRSGILRQTEAVTS